MRYAEIRRRPAALDSHPFVADIAMPATAFPDFERLMQDRQDIRLLGLLPRGLSCRDRVSYSPPPLPPRRGASGGVNGTKHIATPPVTTVRYSHPPGAEIRCRTLPCSIG